MAGHKNKGGDKLKAIWDIWDKGWLRNKQTVYNHLHPHYNPIIDNLKRDLDDGLNRIIIFVGTPRSGKTLSSFWFQCFFNYCYFGREEYRPDPNNLNPLKDVYWKLDDFIEATKDPANQNKFITMEEQGISQYKSMYWRDDVVGFDKITQIFGVDKGFCRQIQILS